MTEEGNGSVVEYAPCWRRTSTVPSSKSPGFCTNSGSKCGREGKMGAHELTVTRENQRLAAAQQQLQRHL
uniref:Uncharacterized protein n=1 Tax=Globodera rostochiensis TaxID=31243 RepID=A0A914HXZ2_GLORO